METPDSNLPLASTKELQLPSGTPCWRHESSPRLPTLYRMAEPRNLAPGGATPRRGVNKQPIKSFVSGTYKSSPRTISGARTEALDSIVLRYSSRVRLTRSRPCRRAMRIVSLPLRLLTPKDTICQAQYEDAAVRGPQCSLLTALHRLTTVTPTLTGNPGRENPERVVAPHRQTRRPMYRQRRLHRRRCLHWNRRQRRMVAAARHY